VRTETATENKAESEVQFDKVDNETENKTLNNI
jgi:hypothetical protein